MSCSDDSFAVHRPSIDSTSSLGINCADFSRGTWNVVKSCLFFVVVVVVLFCFVLTTGGSSGYGLQKLIWMS